MSADFDILAATCRLGYLATKIQREGKTSLCTGAEGGPFKNTYRRV